MDNHKFLILVVTILGLSLTSLSVLAQDIITTKEGEVLKVYIIEQSFETITYREFDDPYQLLFTVPKSSILKIQYVETLPSESDINGLPKISKQSSSGNKFIVDGERDYTLKEIEEFLILDKYAEEHFKSYKNKKHLANVLGFSSIVCIPIGLGVAAAGNDLPSLIAGFLIIIGGTPILGTAGIIALVSANRSKNNAFDAYGISFLEQDSKLKSVREIPQVKLGLVSSGIGLEIRF